MINLAFSCDSFSGHKECLVKSAYQFELFCRMPTYFPLQGKDGSTHLHVADVAIYKMIKVLLLNKTGNAHSSKEASFFSQFLLAVRDYLSFFSMAFEQQKLEMNGSGFSQLPSRHMIYTIATSTLLLNCNTFQLIYCLSFKSEVHYQKQEHLLKCTLTMQFEADTTIAGGHMYIHYKRLRQVTY